MIPPELLLSAHTLIVHRTALTCFESLQINHTICQLLAQLAKDRTIMGGGGDQDRSLNTLLPKSVKPNWNI